MPAKLLRGDSLSAAQLRDKLVKLDANSKEGIEKDPKAIALLFELLHDVVGWIEAHDREHYQRSMRVEDGGFHSTRHRTF
jgi:hypothetical protein